MNFRNNLGSTSALAALTVILSAADWGISPARAEVIAVQFQGANINDSSLAYIPPDMGGAVGNTQIMQILNGVASIYSKTGTLQYQTSDTGFWNSAGISTAITNTGISDPRVIFDPVSQRWFALAISTAPSNNSVLIGVSNTADPLAGFKAVSFTGAPGMFADYPTLAVNNAAITIGTNNFSGSTGGFTGVSLYSIPKADLIAATPSAGNLSRFDGSTAVGITPEGVTSFSGAGTSTTVLSTDGGGLAVSRVSGANAAGASLGIAALPAGISVVDPISPTQPGGALLEGLDSRISSGPYEVGGRIYFANAVLRNGQDQIQWGVLDATTDALLSSGFISLPGQDLTFPSISANASGTFVVGFNGSGAANNIGAYDAVCSAITTTCDTPMELYASPANNYFLDYGYGLNRWGDYSWTSADPSDSNRFWLFQEYAIDNVTWGTVVTAIDTSISPIATPEPQSVGLLAAGWLGLGFMRRRRG